MYLERCSLSADTGVECYDSNFIYFIFDGPHAERCNTILQLYNTMNQSLARTVELSWPAAHPQQHLPSGAARQIAKVVLDEGFVVTVRRRAVLNV